MPRVKAGNAGRHFCQDTDVRCHYVENTAHGGEIRTHVGNISRRALYIWGGGVFYSGVTSDTLMDTWGKGARRLQKGGICLRFNWRCSYCRALYSVNGRAVIAQSDVLSHLLERSEEKH
jgi:hypothetical protein